MNVSLRQHHCYRVCGLRIGSAIPFPELCEETGSKREFPPDLEFRMGGDLSRWDGGKVVMTWEESGGAPWLTCTKTRDGYRLHYTGFADFLIDPAGRRVSCVANPDTEPATIRHLFLDQVMPPLLNLRGTESLHASAVRTPSGACAFVGPSGGGKSTLAASFHVAGHPVLSDDCLILKEDSDHISVEPAYPGLRLWDDSRGAFFGNTLPTLPVSQYTSKQRISTSESNIGEFFPLRGIYSLRRHARRTRRTDPVIEPLSIRDAFMELVEFAYRLDLSDQAMILRQMRVLERVALEIPVRRLRLPDDLGALPAAREMILQDLLR